MLPLLRVVEGGPVPLTSAAEDLAERLSVPEADRTAKPAWAHEPLLVSRTRVTAEWLEAAGLIRRADDRLRLEDRGRALLQENPDSIDRESLRRFPEFEAYLQAYLARQGA